MYTLAKTLYPFHRSITGDNNRTTLDEIKKTIPINIKEVETGKQVFDWKVPQEWKVKEAYIKNKSGDKIIDIKNHNLHLLSYSIPFKGMLTFEELKKHLYYLKEHPNWIPYRTCYYGKNWGFCLTYNQYQQLDINEDYEVYIDSEYYDGSLSYGELIIPGKYREEILLSTYICHPSMCNDNLSGIVLTTYLAKHLLQQDNYYTYRIIFVPETIGAITYLAVNDLNQLKKDIIGGYVITCVGDIGKFTYLQTKKENTITDKITLFALNNSKKDYNLRRYLDCGSDERQYNFPGVDLNIGSLMKTKYLEFNEYHTSGDNLDFISEEALQKSLEMYKTCLNIFENNFYYICNTICEPRLGIHGLWDNIGGTKNVQDKSIFIKILYYCDGKHDILDICHILNKEFNDIIDCISLLQSKKIIRNVNQCVIQKIKRLNFSYNNYNNDYNMNVLYSGLRDNLTENNYDFTNIVNIYNEYKHIESSGVWKWINSKQQDLFNALENNNLEKLRIYFANFFRNNALSNGLVSHNLLDDNVISNDSKRIQEYFNLILQDIDTCRDLTGISSDNLCELNFPKIGNPYGILLNDALILSDQPRHYYDAKKIYDLTIDIDNPTIFEIGGGYGGLLINLYKFFKDKPFTYVNCDICSTSLIFYYVIDNYMNSHNVDSKIHIDASNNIQNNKNNQQNIILNIFNNEFITFKNGIDLVYNSHSLSEMSEEHINLYMDIIMKNNATYFYNINADYFPWKTSYKNHIEINASSFKMNNYVKLSHTISPWICGGNERYREFLFKRRNSSKKSY